MSAAAPNWREDPEVVRARQRIAQASYRDRIAARTHHRGTRVVQLVDRGAVIERDGGLCYLCGEAPAPDELHLDHVIPLERGGEHTMWNLRVACASCNARKRTRLLTELEHPPVMPHALLPTLAVAFGVERPPDRLHEVYLRVRDFKRIEERYDAARLARDEAIRAAGAAGISLRAIAQAGGVSHQAVAKILKAGQ